jgi:hypothetical protein
MKGRFRRINKKRTTPAVVFFFRLRDFRESEVTGFSIRAGFAEFFSQTFEVFGIGR